MFHSYDGLSLVVRKGIIMHQVAGIHFYVYQNFGLSWLCRLTRCRSAMIWSLSSMLMPVLSPSQTFA